MADQKILDQIGTLAESPEFEDDMEWLFGEVMKAVFSTTMENCTDEQQEAVHEAFESYFAP